MSKYLGLLRWSLKYNDGTSPSDVKAMDPERRAWLKEALESQVVDPADMMKNIIKMLQIPRAESASETQEKEYAEAMVAALRALQEWVEQIDWAADLHKLGGFETVINLTQDQDDGVRCMALEVFATVVQNNPVTQAWAMELGALEKIMSNMDLSQGKTVTKEEQAKVLLATASLVRDYTPATVAFIKDYAGVAWLMKIIQEEKFSEKAHHKSLFFMRYIFSSVPAIKIALADKITQTLNQTMLSTNIDIQENSLHLLLAIYSDKNAISKITDATRQATAAAIEQYKPDGEDDFSAPLVKDLSAKLSAYPMQDTSSEAPVLLGN